MAATASAFQCGVDNSAGFCSKNQCLADYRLSAVEVRGLRAETQDTETCRLDRLGCETVGCG